MHAQCPFWTLSRNIRLIPQDLEQRHDAINERQMMGDYVSGNTLLTILFLVDLYTLVGRSERAEDTKSMELLRRPDGRESVRDELTSRIALLSS